MVDPRTQKLYEQLISGEGSGDIFRDDAVANEYDKNASVIFGKDLEQYAADIDFLLDLTTYSPKDIVVDLGCGTGISTLRILERNPERVIGLDFSEPMLRQAREKLKNKGNVEFRVASAEELSNVIENADKVVSANVFQYISDPDVVLQGVYDSLNPNGEYLFNVKVKAPKEQSIYFHLFRNLEEALSEELDKEVKLPELKGLEPKYDRNDLETISKRNEFKVARYEGKPIIYDNKHLRAFHQQILDGMIPELEKSIGKKKVDNIIKKVRKGLQNMYTPEGFLAGQEAYVLLRK